MRKLRTRAGLGALIVLGAATLAVVVPTGAASAHDDVVSSNPAADSSIDSDPGVVTLDFSEALYTSGQNPDGFAAQVIDSEGLHYESGCVAVDGAQLTAPVALGDAGAYVVVWRVASNDGHPTSGQFEFDYEPASLDGAHDGLTDAPVCGQAWAGEPDGAPTPTAAPAAPTPAATSTETTDSGGTTVQQTFTATETAAAVGGELQNPAAGLPVPVIVLLGVVGLGAIVAIVLIAVRRSRSGGYGEQ
ncbi:copper resistance CopC family protein [Herbiconiux daphne]|uniref:Copper resistance protein CopC n=1 Tax=Herbiconiux daphne TaxID=2970914 RepID=A0ABT2H2T5_9MICO|nr:copper resistance CopC family protein [Herbiconiux daphne]MCS5734222.1 copper resistance protein CopC [Herbiconiux daphne]